MEGSNEILIKYKKDQCPKTGTEGDNSIRCGRTYMKPCKFKSQAKGNRVGGWRVGTRGCVAVCVSGCVTYPHNRPAAALLWRIKTCVCVCVCVCVWGVCGTSQQNSPTSV